MLHVKHNRIHIIQIEIFRPSKLLEIPFSRIVFIHGGSHVHGQILSGNFGSFEIEFLYFLCPLFEGSFIFS